MIERDLHDDPAAHRTTYVMGLDARQTATLVVCVLFCALVLWLFWSHGWDMLLSAVVMAVVCAPVVFVGAVRLHDLPMEELVGIMRKEMGAPQELRWEPPVTASWDEPDPLAGLRGRELREAKRLAKQQAKQRRAERETDRIPEPWAPREDIRDA